MADKCGSFILKHLYLNHKNYFRPNQTYTGVYADGKHQDYVNEDGSPRTEGDQSDNKDDKFRFYITTRRLISF